ncbi:beta-lactamase family protein [Myxococcus sp. CA033]|uniref:serine hydrolase domain-containing protein n=1 Tax=Myxococcus sp. CA033 TaxID=2741516 RepID=UPI00157AEDA8|nr:serine hydrolase domain-containing protein [Myxococcus sp. CA033]NTX36031.1 beta-lactamase family protein [Myxococcus sp. CA033]
MSAPTSQKSPDAGAGSRGPAVAREPALAARVDAGIDWALAQKRIVGTVVMVARNGQEIYRRAAGFFDREAGTPMRDDALFRLASLTKQYVSVAAMALLEQGVLRLEDPVTRWIPSFRPKLEDGSEPVITVRHLMTHTAGLTYSIMESEDGPYHRANVSSGLDQPGLSMEENLRRIVSVPLSYVPGTRWGYSVATDVLGEVLARAADATLPRLVEQLVTGPLGLKDTGFHVVDTARLATPYGDGKPEPVRMGKEHWVSCVPSNVPFVPDRVFDARSFAAGGSSMVGTAEDFLKLLEALRTGGAPVLKSSTVEAFATESVGVEAATLAPGWGFGLGMGVLVDPGLARSPQPKGTWQWMGAYGHTWFVDPVNQFTIVALTNTAFEGMFGAFPKVVRDAVYGVTR